MLNKETENNLTEAQQKHYKELDKWFKANPEIYEEFKLGWMKESLEEFIEDNISNKSDLLVELAEELEYPHVDRMIDEGQNHHVKFRIR